MTFRLVQITDLHLLETPGTELYGVDTAASLSQTLSAIENLPVRPQAIVASGDLVENATQASYERLRMLMEPLGIPVYTLAGNHDDLEQMKLLLNRGCFSCIDSVALGEWRGIFVNSQVHGQSHGYVSDTEMVKIQSLICEYEKHPVLVALHHTPSKVCPSDGCQLQNSKEFTALLNVHANVKAVVAGHTHTETEANAGNHMQYTTPSTFACVTHAQPGEPVDHEDFWSAHRLHQESQGFRVLDLYSDGSFETEIHWLDSASVS